MGDNNNRLELDMVSNDLTGTGSTSANKNILSVEQQAAKTAAAMSRSFDGTAIEMSRSFDRASTVSARSLQALEQRAALVGKTGADKLLAQKRVLIDRAGSDEAQIQRIVRALDKLISTQQRADRASSTRLAGTRAGEAILAGEAEFQEALRRMQTNNDAFRKLQQDRIRTSETPTQRVARERTDFLGRYGGSPAQRASIEKEFDLHAQTAKNLETRAAGIAAGKATLPGEAAFQEALHRVQARDSEIRDLEDRAKKATLPRADYLEQEKRALLGRAGMTESAAKRIVAAYNDLKKAEGGEGGSHGNYRQLLYGLKDASEGYTRGVYIRGLDFLVGTGNQGGVLSGILPKITELTGLSSGAVIAVGGLTAGLVALGFAGIASMHHLGEAATQIRNLSLETGISTGALQHFEFAAKASGANPEIIQRLTRGLSQIAGDDSAPGAKGRTEIAKLGINLRDDFGNLRPTEDIVLQLADAIGKLPPGLQQSAAAMEIFKRAGVDSVPFLHDLRALYEKSGHLGPLFSEEEIQNAERWHQQMVEVSTTLERMKIQTEYKLAVVIDVIITGAKKELSALLNAAKDYSAFALGAEKGTVGERFQQNFTYLLGGGEPEETNKPLLTLNGPLSDQQRLGVDNVQRYKSELAKYKSSNALDDKIARLREEASGVAHLTPGGDPTHGISVLSAAKQLKAAEEGKRQSERISQGLISAGKEREQLASEAAQIAESSQLKEITAATDSKKEMLGPEDAVKLLDLAKQRAIADQNRIINEQRKYTDQKTGATIDQSNTAAFQKILNAENANLPQRIENEQAKVQADVIDAKNAKYYRTQADDIFKGSDEQAKHRQEAERTYRDITEREQRDATDQYYRDQEKGLEREKALALQNISLIDAQTLEQKKALEDQKLAIEEVYAQRSLAIQLQRLDTDRTREEGKLEGEARSAGKLGSDDYLAAKALIDQRYQNQADSLRASSYDKELELAQQVANEKSRIEIEENRKVYGELKKESEGFVDALFSKNPGASLKKWASNLFEGLAKDILSSQIAASLTGAVTGKNVSFDPLSAGGRVGGILGRLGLGAPKFENVGDKLNQPNHLGDLNLVSGAVPVVLANAPQVAQQHAQASGSFLGPLVGGLGALAGATGAAASTAAQAVASVGQAIGTASSTTLGGIIDQTSIGPVNDAFSGMDLGSFGNLAQIVGGPGGTSGFAGPVAGAQSGFGGLLGGLFGGGRPSPLGGIDEHGVLHSVGSGTASGGGGGILGGLGGLFSKGGLSHFIGQDASGIDLGNGVGIANTGLLGHLASFGTSPAAGLAGSLLAFDGIKRGGIAGTAESTAGGALLGFRLSGGNPIGAAIGAGVGLVAGLIRTFIGDDRSHTKNLVKQIYGISINNATADQIVAIAKQSYGGQISMAVRSPEVRQLIKLYAQTLGTPKQQAQFVNDTPHAGSLVEANGQLQQRAFYENGISYSYQSPLSTYQGPASMTVPTYESRTGQGPTTIQLNVNGQSASDLLAGQVANVATPSFVQSQALSASNASFGRLNQQNMALSPSAISR